MKNWESTLITADSSLREALEAIDLAGTQIALIVDKNRRLLGTLSDGDVRRAMLRGVKVDDRVDCAMHTGARVINSLSSNEEIQDLMRLSGCNQLPIVNSEGVVVGLSLISDFFHPVRRENWVIIMAGGLGTRLNKLTQNTPKPMLKVGSRPILETIIQSYTNQGFFRFYMAVNYKAEQIVAHFGDGSAFGVDIRYLFENIRLGTAGALSMLPERPSAPVIVTNADLLTTVNFGNLLDQHERKGAQATMAVRQYEMQVPFGVVNMHDDQIYSIEEKPIKSFLVSAGIYALSPEALDLVPSEQFFDMPSLFDAILERGLKTHAHQIEEYWLDIGQLPDYEKANRDFEKIFNDWK
jgi:dTDP-glucose pyrophosphorylase